MSVADFAVQILKDDKTVARAAAEIFVNLAPAPNEKPRPFRAVLAGGTTPRALYGLLSSPEYRGRVAWNHVEFFFGDERAVPPDHPDSNYAAASERLFRPLGISAARIHRMKAENADLEAAAADYEKELRSAFDGAGMPRFELILLGMGQDGHTASLFPGSSALAEGRRWVVPVTDAPKPPPCRLTLTIPVLNAARLVVFMAAGSDKAPAVREALQGNAPPDQCPARHIRPGPERLAWLVDEAAAAGLSMEGVCSKPSI